MLLIDQQWYPILKRSIYWLNSKIPGNLARTHNQNCLCFYELAQVIFSDVNYKMIQFQDHYLSITLDWTVFCGDSVALQIADDVVSRFGVVFVRIFHQILQHHIWLQLFGSFYVDDFISHGIPLLWKCIFNSIAHRKESGKYAVLKNNFKY